MLNSEKRGIEMEKYLDLKEKTLKDEKINKSGKENEYGDSESIQNLDKFLVKSCVKDYTKPNNLYSAKNAVIENGKYMVNKLYELYEKIYGQYE